MAQQSGKHIAHVTIGALGLLGMLLLSGGLHGQDNFSSLVNNAQQALNAGRLEEAIQLASQASQIKPGDPEPYNIAGNAWYNQNEFQKALDRYSAAIQADPGFKFGYLNRGLCYYKLSDTTKAMRDYQKVVKLDPNYSLVYNEMGLIFYDRGSTGYAQALEYFNTAISKDARSKYPYYNKGLVFTNTGRYDDAIREFKTAVSLDSNYVDAHQQLGSAYSQKEDYHSAIIYYTRAISLDPKNKFYYRNRGYCYQRIQDEDMALRDYKQALVLDPKYGVAYNDIGLIYFDRQFRDTSNIQKALDNFTLSIQYNPGLVYPYYNRGLIQYNRKNYTAATLDFDRTLQIDSNYSDASYRRGLSYFFLENYPLAIKDFNHTLRVKPRHENALYYLGKVFIQTKEFNKAVESFNKVLAINGRNTDAMLDKAFAFLYGGKFDDALETFNQIIRSVPDNTTAWNGRGLTYFYKGKYAEAAQDFVSCLRMDSTYGNAKANLVVTLLADNQFNTAQSVYGDYKNKNLSSFIDNSKFQFVSTYIQACVYHIRTGNYDNASTLLQTAIKEFEQYKKLDSYDYLTGQRILGNIYAKLGYIMELKAKPAEAKNFYRQGLAINPQLPEANLGYVSQIVQPANIMNSPTRSAGMITGNDPGNSMIIPALDSVSTQFRFHALLIAEEEYDNTQFTRLKRPVEDALRLKNILINQYNFDASRVTLLKNADRNAILATMNGLLRDKNENDNILIFYAGHGTCDKNDRGDVIEGYWVPVGAKKGQTEQYVSGSEMRVALNKTAAKHVVIISDACFSGGLTRDVSLDDASGHVQQLYRKTSRQLLASGNLEPVPDNSVFLVYLLKELEGNKNAFLTMNELWQRIHTIVSNNTSTNTVPICVPFRDTGDELGQFILVRKE
jgi:tetratricopeptide (TPR) repeat protein